MIQANYHHYRSNSNQLQVAVCILSPFKQYCYKKSILLKLNKNYFTMQNKY